ncbi:EAL domain-containing protein [Herbaspirillum sp. HC18]|nr:EAL domain-containing protein [Herbaspirillum sp. HC18]
MEIASMLADEILRRSDETTDQILAAFRQLLARGTTEPCSDENIRLMAAIRISEYQLLEVGYVSGDRLICSSLGQHDANIFIGPPDYLSAQGVQVRTSVSFPLRPDEKLMLATDPASGYTAIIHRDQPIDVFMDRPNISVGLLGYTSKKWILGHGIIKPEWIRAMGERDHAKLVDGEYLVAIRHSHKYDYAAFAAIPLINVDEGIRRLAVTLLPLGILAGIILTPAVLYVAKLQMALPAVMKSGLKRNEFFILYQPIVDLRSREWIGAEVLVRWRRPDGEILRPDIFIPVAEENGLIQPLTERTIGIVARDAAGLFRQHPGFHLGINLASDDMHSTRTVEILRGLVRATAAAPGNLMVEMTERGLMKADVAREVIRALRAEGLRVAVDDFGTGYSSLSYLETFELDYLKIDKSFVDTIGTGAATSQVVLHIIEMAKDLKLQMIAEGVESEIQAEFLAERGVQYGQGWLFGKPMTFKELVEGLNQKRMATAAAQE